MTAATTWLKSAQFLRCDGEYLVPGADRDEMAGTLDGMPHRAGHCVGHGLVDRVRDEKIVQSLPQVDRPLYLLHVESPTPVEEFSVADQAVGTVGEAFGT